MPTALSGDVGALMKIERAPYVRVAGFGGVGVGVFWIAWTNVGFWWALLYGAFWPVWVGARVASLLFGMR